MKKALTLAGALLALAVCLSAALAAGGSAGDPLISLSYLEGTFTQSADAAVESRLDGADDDLREELRLRLDAMGSALRAAAGQQVALTAQEATLKEGDVLIGVTGSDVLPLAGEVHLSLAQGAVVDVTEGLALTADAFLTNGRRYIVAEDTVAYFTVTSPTAVLSHQGGYAFSLSGDTPDYYAMARALRDLGLFRGSGSGIGEGFDLHLAPTRGEGLILFIRILGEEAEALACAAPHPFTDVPKWLDPYVSWAYQQGYTNGVSPTSFAPAQTISAVEYQEFLLRALGYSVAGVHDYTTALDRALACGALTPGEYDMLSSESFLRSHVAYLSYYALDMALSGSRQTLGERLEEQGLFSHRQLENAQSWVTSSRLR